MSNKGNGHKKSLLNKTNIALVMTSIFLAALIGSCTENSFKGSTPRKGAVTTPTPTPTPTETPPPEPISDDANPIPEGDITDDGSNDNLNPGDITDDGSFCKETDQWNITLVFDDSGSQSSTDPGQPPLRQLGAQKFIQTFADFLVSHPLKKVNISVVKFASDAETLTKDGIFNLNKGWYDLMTDNRTKIDQAIVTATSNPEGGTRYSPAFNEAIDLMSKIGASVDKETHRNFVVFLTDGAPNLTGLMPPDYPAPTETEEDIHVPVTTLVNNYGVATIIIATGPRLGDDHLYGGQGGISDTKAEQIAQSLALPLLGVKNPTHIGKYRRASTAAEAEASWDNLFNDIVICH